MNFNETCQEWYVPIDERNGPLFKKYKRISTVHIVFNEEREREGELNGRQSKITINHSCQL